MPRMDFTPPSTPLHSHMVKSVQKVSADIAVDLNKVPCNATVTHHSHSQLKSRTDSTQRASPENECHVRAGSAAVIQAVKSPVYPEFRDCREYMPAGAACTNLYK